MFEIEENVSLPKRGIFGGRHNRKYPFRNMKIGDSFFVGGEGKKGKAHTAAKVFQHRNKEYKFVVSQENDGLRVWRVEAE